ncbi:translation initiation factor IF-2 [Candidatus Woesearchaeota archaeon]|nr:translation initiation factor IF-2 [Candidatus Woesearchaeota archaeon]
MALRSPLCVVLAHVDHGKTSILDSIRGTAIAEGEAGGITQAIGASIIPLSSIQNTCGKLLEALKIKFTLPGLLFIDTPGHAGFVSLRKRGGNLADIAILVIDILDGAKPQTVESIEILKHYKTPFVIAANKVDLIQGWRPAKGRPILKTIDAQSEQTRALLDKKLYEVVGKMAELGFDSERFDRVDDFTKRIAIIPTSAMTGEGIPELLMVVAGLAQKFLEKQLVVESEGYAKGTILEVKPVKGLGLCMDVILYDGMLKRGDTIVVGTTGEALISKVKGLFEPQPLAEMRDKKAKFGRIEKINAATGVRISAVGLENVFSGMPLRSCSPAESHIVAEDIKKEVEEVLLETGEEGIVIKADTLGSLEALEFLLREKNIPIKKASIGTISKKDLMDAEANIIKNPLWGVVLGFNVELEQGINENGANVLTNNVIYKLLEDFEQWQKDKKREAEEKALSGLARPCKFQILKGYVFRQNNPAVVGILVLAGTLQVGTPVMKEDGDGCTSIKAIQVEQENVEKVEAGKQAAASMEGVTVGRQIHEGDILFSAVPEQDFKQLKGLKGNLSEEEKTILREIAEIRRKKNPLWGV